MRVGIHQPNYIPWGGYFYKVLHSDVFIFLDDAQYTKNSLINRNKIKTAAGAAWLTIPVKGSISKTIHEIGFAVDSWANKHISTLQMNYAKAPYTKDYLPQIAECMLKPYDNLANHNIPLIQMIAGFLGAKCVFLRSSEMKAEGKSDKKLAALVCEAEGTVYLSGKGGANYQSEETFAQNGVKLAYTNYVQREYPQLWGPFEANLSILDILFNCGDKSAEWIRGSVQ